MSTYLLDGQEARDDAYVRAINGLPADAPGCIQVALPENGQLSVSTYPGGFLLQHDRPDGSCWATRRPVNRDEVKKRVAGFLTGRDDWNAGLDWDQVALTTREGRRRKAWILLIGAILVALALLLVRLFTN